MIEQLLKKQPGTFRYGKVAAIDAINNNVRVNLGEGSAWIKTNLTLEIGISVIVARNEDSSWFIVQDSRKALPSQGVLLLI